MPFDADLVLRGPVSGAYVDLDSSDLAATTIAQNGDGNYVVDLGAGGTGSLGLECVIILHDQPTTYTNLADFVIEDSDHLTDGWESLLTFPRLYAYMREIIVVPTTNFVATDIGLVADATGVGNDSGIIRQFSRNLLTGLSGKMWIEMQDSGDTYANSGDTITATSGTGIGTQQGVGRVIQTPLIMVRRFSTPKRYVRLGADAPDGGNFGDVDVLLTYRQYHHVNNLDLG